MTYDIAWGDLAYAVPRNRLESIANHLIGGLIGAVGYGVAFAVVGYGLGLLAAGIGQLRPAHVLAAVLSASVCFAAISIAPYRETRRTKPVRVRVKMPRPGNLLWYLVATPRQIGGVYQFRHAMLRDRLANQFTDKQSTARPRIMS